MTATMEPTSDTSPLVERLKDRHDLQLKLLTPAERKKIREDAGASISEIAADVGVTYAAVWQWENRPPKRIRREHAIAYLRVLRQLAALAEESQPLAQAQQ